MMASFCSDKAKFKFAMRSAFARLLSLHPLTTPLVLSEAVDKMIMDALGKFPGAGEAYVMANGSDIIATGLAEAAALILKKLCAGYVSFTGRVCCVPPHC
jgi:hypothetical protein